MEKGMTVRTLTGEWKGERMKVRRFKWRDDGHKFLNKVDNALNWREVREGEPTKTGTYVQAGVDIMPSPDLDPTVLAHI